MIKIDSSKAVTISIEGIDYRVDDDDSYRSLLICLTNPDPDVRFPDEQFDVDPSVQEVELLEIAMRYSDFFKAYSKRRNDKLEAESEAIREGFQACKDATRSLNQGIETVKEQ